MDQFAIFSYIISQYIKGIEEEFINSMHKYTILTNTTFAIHTHIYIYSWKTKFPFYEWTTYEDGIEPMLISLGVHATWLRLSNILFFFKKIIMHLESMYIRY